MCINVVANGDGAGTHVSVYLSHGITIYTTSDHNNDHNLHESFSDAAVDYGASNRETMQLLKGAWGHADLITHTN